MIHPFRQVSRLTPNLALLLIIATSLILSSAFSACQTAKPWKGLAKVGLVMPFTRYDSRTAYDALMGVRLAIREWNAKDGVKGYRVELVALDDENDPEVAARRARELAVDPGVIGVIGHLSGKPALQAADEYRRAGMPLLTFASAPGLTAKGDKAVLRLGPDDLQLARAVLDSLSAGFGLERVAIVQADDLPSSGANAGPGSELGDALEGEVQRRRGAVVWRDSLSPAARGFEPTIAHLRESRAQLVFFLGDYRQASALSGALSRGLPQTAFIIIGEDTPDFLKVGGENARGAMYVAPWPMLKRESGPAKTFVEKYSALAGAEPLRYAPVAYDAVSILLGAAERGYSRTGGLSMVAALGELARGGEFIGVSGIFQFDANGDLVLSRPVVYRVDEPGSYPGVAVR